MRTKNILSVAAFVLAFGLSAAFASLFIPETQTESYVFQTNDSRPTNCFSHRRNSAVANKIADFINADKRNGRESERAAYEYGRDIFTKTDGSAISGYADAVEGYVDDSSRLDADALPDDLQPAWREHIKAWRDYSNFLNRMKKSSNRAGWSVEELESTDDFHSREITRTWRNVIQIGRSYGANVY